MKALRRRAVRRTDGPWQPRVADAAAIKSWWASWKQTRPA
jgi:hypothetical protein